MNGLQVSLSAIHSAYLFGVIQIYLFYQSTKVSIKNKQEKTIPITI